MQKIQSICLFGLFPALFLLLILLLNEHPTADALKLRTVTVHAYLASRYASDFNGLHYFRNPNNVVKTTARWLYQFSGNEFPLAGEGRIGVGQFSKGSQSRLGQFFGGSQNGQDIFVGTFSGQLDQLTMPFLTSTILDSIAGSNTVMVTFQTDDGHLLADNSCEPLEFTYKKLKDDDWANASADCFIN